MGLIDLWRSSPDIASKRVDQIIAVAGTGKLLDGSDTSSEFRTFLAAVDSPTLCRYAEECLSVRFDGNGLALQDIVNEIGHRLGFAVEPGVYRGSQAGIGHDGLWHRDGRTLVVEVKTTDAYTMDLATPIGYRRALADANKLALDASSVLIVVGREDTGALEAQVRGSRHAWDIRLISVDGLSRLLKIKDNVEEPGVAARIRNLLAPQEFTKVDAIIDLVFATAEDVMQAEEEIQPDTGKPGPAHFHQDCILRIAQLLQTPLVKQSRVLYASPDRSTAVVCTVSREYDPNTRPSYWYAVHPHQLEALSASTRSFLAFGCGSARTILLIPLQDFRPWVDGMNTTQLEDTFYWHVSVYKKPDGRFHLHRKKAQQRIDLTKYLLTT
jgi:hypothetical protein